MNEKGQSIDANTKMTEMLYLSDKDFKAAMIKAIRNTLKQTRKIERLSKETESLRRENTRYKEKLNGRFRTKRYKN